MVGFNMPEEKKKLHVCREDPNWEKEDIRPIERRKKPKFSMAWKKIKEILDLD